VKFIAGGFKKKPARQLAQQEVSASSWTQRPSAHLSAFALLYPQHQAEDTEYGEAEYVKDLGRRTVLGELDGLADLPHARAQGRLVSFKGIGPWTADGALFIAFGGLDVLVSGDLMLRKAVQRAYGLPAMPTEKEVEALGKQWRPHRSLAAGYLFGSMMPAHQKERKSDSSPILAGL